jgi:hypothetical protein
VFNRSKKYVFLLIINIVVLLVWYLNNDDQTIDDPFDTEYVIGLLESEERLSRSVSKLNQQISDLEKRVSQRDTQIEQTQVLVRRSEQKAVSCEREIDILIRTQREQVERSTAQTNSAIASSCDSQDLEVSIARARADSLESLVADIRQKFTQTQEELIQKNQLLSQIQNNDNKELQSLRQQVDTLKRNLNEPISLEKHYLSARYCNKPKFTDLICVQEFLVRPSFTKMPITSLLVKIMDATGTEVATGEFNSAQSQLYRLTLGRGKELKAGDYMVEYKIDNQTLLSEFVELNQ